MENVNKEKLLKDYYKCIGAFENCYYIYDRIDALSQVKDSYIDKKAFEGQKEDLLSNLGKVGEKAFKYLYGLEILRMYPNIDSENFESHFCKDGPLKNFLKKHGVTSDDDKLKEIFSYIDINNQKSHNYDYWYTVLKIAMPKTIEKFEQLVIYKRQSTILLDFCKNNEDFVYQGQLVPYITDAVFPQSFEIRANNKLFLSKAQTKNILTAQRDAIKQSGDIFTRLRYASNNPDKKEFDLNEVFYLITDLVDFIEMVHENDDNLDLDIDSSYGLEMALKYKKELGMSEEEIKAYFDLGIPTSLLSILFFENVKYKEAKALLDLGVKKEDMLKVVLKNLNSRSIKHFHSIGIYDYNEMERKLHQFIIDGKPITK